MEATFENSVDVLVKAYLNDTLQRGECHACAVGNLIQSGVGRLFTECEKDELRFHQNGWVKVFITMSHNSHYQRPENYKGIAKIQIDATGYSWQDLAKIEFAFESAPRTGDEMFNGLMAVVDVLAEIHGVDLTVKENAVGMFVEVHATKA